MRQRKFAVRAREYKEVMDEWERRQRAGETMTIFRSEADELRARLKMTDELWGRCPSSWLAYACAIGPRSNLPGNAPVCSFFRKTTWPLTMDASSPSDFCFSRRAPAGKS